MNYDLKPCPFCGGTANLYTVIQPNGDKTYAVDCHNEGCDVSPSTSLFDTEYEAVAVWNRRIDHADT